jgi:hypothetical protein
MVRMGAEPDGAGTDDPEAPSESWATARPAINTTALLNVGSIQSLLLKSVTSCQLSASSFQLSAISF